MIDVARSPSYRKAQSELEALATEIAEQAIVFSAALLERLAITLHEGEVTEDPERIREFMFLGMENRPVLQICVDAYAQGPLTLVEVRTHFLDRPDESLTTKDCGMRSRRSEETR